jgi:hypothetical protein
MDSTLRDLFQNMGQKIIGYLPDLFAGLVLLGTGWFLGWFVKRVVVRICVLLHLERLVRAFRWGGGLSRADVRHAVFNWVGNVAFFLVFLAFLNAALDTMRVRQDRTDRVVARQPRDQDGDGTKALDAPNHTARDRDRFVEGMPHAIAPNGSFFDTQRVVLQYVLKACFE